MNLVKYSQEAQTSIPQIQDLCTVRTDCIKNLIWSAPWARMVWSMVMKPVWLIRPTSKVHPHGARSWFYAHLLNSLLRASSLFSSTCIFYILFYAHLLYSLLRASSWFSLSAKSLIEPGLTGLKWSTRAQKLQIIHPVLWENYEVILSGTTVTLHTGCPQTNSGRHQLISIHIYTASYVWRTAIVHSKNGNLTFVVRFGSSMNPLGCFGCPEQAWLPQTEGGNPEWWRHIALRLRLRGSPLWSRCNSQAPSLFSRNPK